MKTPYLIQSGRTKTFNPDAETMDDLIQFDYMGAAEYEYGALPASYTRIIESLVSDHYMLFYIKIAERDITVWCKLDEIDAVTSNIQKVYDGVRLKERANFKQSLDDPNPSWRTPNIWWDIENDYLFWISDDKFREQLHKIVSIRITKNNLKK